MVLGVAAVGVLSFIFGKVIFTAVPALLAELTRPIFPSHTGQIIVESVIKLMLLLSYIYFISLTPLIKRVFQYHGAEHKVINAYENNLSLTVENVQNKLAFIIVVAVASLYLQSLLNVCLFPCPYASTLGQSGKPNFINSSRSRYFF